MGVEAETGLVIGAVWPVYHLRGELDSFPIVTIFYQEVSGYLITCVGSWTSSPAARTSLADRYWVRNRLFNPNSVGNPNSVSAR